MKRLYIDFDGVIMDTIPLLYDALAKSKIDASNELSTRNFFATYNFDKIINDDNILNNSIDDIKKLIESNRFEISILTHVNSLDEAVVKTKYLRSKFHDITIIIVPKEISKTMMIHSNNAVLVDDYSGNLREWEASGGIPIRFSKELETTKYITINRLEKLLDIFEKEGE